MRVVIVEDDFSEANKLKSALQRYGSETGLDFEILHYTDAETFLKKYSQERPSIVFFDIELSTINGMDAARLLRERDDAVVIIFVTKLVQFAQKGYEVKALDFLIKPIIYDDFHMKMLRAVNVAKANEVKTILVPADSGFFRVSSDKIVFVEVMGHNIRYQLTDGVVEARGTLSGAEEKLAGHGFLRCNSCYLVNSRYVESVRGYDLYIGGHVLKISHPRRKEFVKQLMNLYTGSSENPNGGGLS